MMTVLKDKNVPKRLWEFICELYHLMQDWIDKGILCRDREKPRYRDQLREALIGLSYQGSMSGASIAEVRTFCEKSVPALMKSIDDEAEAVDNEAKSVNNEVNTGNDYEGDIYRNAIALTKWVNEASQGSNCFITMSKILDARSKKHLYLSDAELEEIPPLLPMDIKKMLHN